MHLNWAPGEADLLASYILLILYIYVCEIYIYILFTLISGTFCVGDAFSAEKQAVVSRFWLSRPIWAKRLKKNTERDGCILGGRGSLGDLRGLQQR